MVIKHRNAGGMSKQTSLVVEKEYDLRFCCWKGFAIVKNLTWWVMFFFFCFFLLFVLITLVVVCRNYLNDKIVAGVHHMPLKVLNALFLYTFDSPTQLGTPFGFLLWRV